MKQRHSGGRPSLLKSGLIQDEILDAATHLFLAEGYGSTSIEKVATECGISKRTFYHRFENKEELFAAVVHRLIGRLRPSRQDTPQLFEGGTLEAILRRLADIIIDVVLAPESLALHRIVISEATRFPELAIVMETEGSKAEAISRIAQLLDSEARAGRITIANTRFAAEQFLQMLIGVPQRRALGLGAAMIPAELAEWKTETVRLFLHGCGLK